MAAKYEINDVLTPTSTTPVFTLKAHPRGTLEKFIIVQTGAGASDGYTFDLLSIHPDDLPAGHNINTYKICPTQTVAGSSTTKEIFTAYPYKNQKATTVPTGAIYLKMTITTAYTNKTFAVGYLTSSDLGT